MKSREKSNRKSREKVHTIIDESEQKKIQVELNIESEHRYDSSNALVLPSAKRKTIKIRSLPPTKLLTRKQRKRLLKIKEAKEKKMKANSLMEALQQMQLKPMEMEPLTSLQQTQTVGRKTFLNPLYTEFIDNPQPKTNEGFQQKLMRWRHPRKRVKMSDDFLCYGRERLKLPILSEEHVIMEAINENPVVIIVGPTGSGKTTQVPQFLYEAGYTSNRMMIGVSEPRRVAAIAMSERVAYEMGLSYREISYHVRFEGNHSEHTQIKFMTDGILLKEIQKDFLLKKYSVLVIDEAHERNVYSDLLIGLLSRLLLQRNTIGVPLKLIIMSATLRIQDFTENKYLFKVAPPLIQIDSRLFEVNLYYNKTTDPDYVEAAFRKVCDIHRQLPDGTILVFLSGQNEIHLLCERFQEVFPTPLERKNAFKQEKEKKSGESFAHEISLLDLVSHTSNACDCTEASFICDSPMTFRRKEMEQPLLVIPLYAKLAAHEQRKVFQLPPPGVRLCVVATNVAETSLTIPNVKYVVDPGKVKQKIYDHVRGVSLYEVVWISKASANQRAGRAGRVCHGYCYRLYSSAVFNDEFEEHMKPEILRTPIDDVVLLLKFLRVRIMTFPFPTPPDPLQVQESIKQLVSLGALKTREELVMSPNRKEPQNKFVDTTVITEQGEEMAILPVAARFSKMISQSNQHPCIMPYVILIIAALTFEDFLLDVPLDGKCSNEWENHLAGVRLSWSHNGPIRELGDLLIIINAVLEAGRNNASVEWCIRHGVRHKQLTEIQKLRYQLTLYIKDTFSEVVLSSDMNLDALTSSRATILSQVILTGSAGFVAKKVNYKIYEESAERLKWKNSYRTIHSDEPVYIVSSSVLHKQMPPYIMYQNIQQTTKKYFTCVTAISSSWLMNCTPLMCTFSAPLDTPLPRYIPEIDSVVCHRKATYGPRKWEVAAAETPFPESKELYKWVAYFILKGDICPPLKEFTKFLYDPDTLKQPVCIRYKEQRENLVSALQSRAVTSWKALQKTWLMDPQFLRNEYFAWCCQENMVNELKKKWPPL